MSPSSPNELLPVVDGRDRPLRPAPRGEVHAQGLRHRAVHILVFDPSGPLYLQKRSMSKDTHPGKWTSSASGHVDWGEDYGPAARRELAEELGLALELAEVARLAASARTENEFVRIYQAVTDQTPTPEAEEIAEGRWFSWDQAMALAADLEQSAPSLQAALEAYARARSEGA